MEIPSVAKRWTGVVTLLKAVGLAILVLVPIYQFVWHRPAELPGNLLQRIPQVVPGEVDMDGIETLVTPLAYITTVQSADRSDVVYRITHSRRSDDYSVRTYIGRVDTGHLFAWFIVLALLCYLGYRLCFSLLPRIFASRCPRCREIMTREDTQLMGPRRLGDLTTPYVLKATYRCDCGYERSKVYTEQVGSAVDTSGRFPVLLRDPEGKDKITEDEWEQQVKALRKEHETPR